MPELAAVLYGLLLVVLLLWTLPGVGVLPVVLTGLRALRWVAAGLVVAAVAGFGLVVIDEVWLAARRARIRRRAARRAGHVKTGPR